jgi:hypothetical protein
LSIILFHDPILFGTKVLVSIALRDSCDLSKRVGTRLADVVYHR